MANQRPPGFSRRQILDHLIDVADEYGEVTQSHRQIGNAVGLSRVAVLDHLHILEDDGVITVVRTDNGYGNVIQLRADLY